MESSTPQALESILPFPRKEFDDRLQLIQSILDGKNLSGCLLFNPENIYWLTSYQTIDYFTVQCLYVQCEGLPVVVSRLENTGLGRVIPTIGNFVGFSDPDKPIDLLVAFLKKSADLSKNMRFFWRLFIVRRIFRFLKFIV